MNKYEATEILGYSSEWTVVRNAGAGRLPGVKRGGFKRGAWFWPIEAIEAFKTGDAEALDRIAKALPTAVVPRFMAPARRPRKDAAAPSELDSEPATSAA